MLSRRAKGLAATAVGAVMAAGAPGGLAATDGDTGDSDGGDGVITGCASLSSEQTQMAQQIWDVSDAMNIPERGRVAAYATAIQESGMQNLDHGDRDSLGLFQQRPSQGWGSASQVTDPETAARAFYQALRGVDDWQSMSVTEAAQAVQRSAYPNAYADHADAAEALVDADGCT